MRSVFRVYAMLALTGCVGGGLRADDAAVTADRFPDADVVVVNEIERTAYRPDGTYVTTDESWTKILTEKGRRSEGTITLGYNRRYSAVKIAYVGIIGTNGVERAVDVSATTKDMTDNSSMSENIYDPLDRNLVCAIPGLEVGETLHVRNERRTFKPRCENQWADMSVMEWKCPILAATWEITAPAERPLKKIAVRHPLGNVVSSRRQLPDGSTVHTFACTNAPQAFAEPDMPPLYTQVQNVRVSTAADWPEISRWYWNLCAPHLAKTSPAISNKVAELVAAAGDDEAARVRAIFKFVSQEIRYMGLTMEDTSPGYAPHDVDITFANRYGVCRDKGGLLVAMLRLAGINAFPVLIHAGAKLDPEVPQPFFNHAITAVDVGNRDYRLMDPTNESTKDLFPSYLCDKSYIVCRPEGEGLRTSPIPSPEHNTLAVDTRGALAKDGSLFLESELRFDGVNDTVYRHVFVRRTREERVKLFERIVKGVTPGAELLTCSVEPTDMSDTERPVRVKIAARYPETILRGETADQLNIPYISRSLGMVNYLLAGNTALERRRFPLVLDTTARVVENLSIDLGGAVGAMRECPPDEKGQLPGYRCERRFGVTNGTLTVVRALTVGAVEFDPAAYAELREEIKRVEAAERKRPVFASDRLADADVRYLLEDTDVTISSDRSWTVTNTVVKEVLTYAGKKGSAELKFGYNPVIEKIDLVSAVVSNRDGRVHSVSSHEKNEMDCGWAASAPRYPAGRTLVVNLPSVELGSVISYTFVRTVTNAPTAYYGVFGFDSQEPLDRRRVRVNDWTREVVMPRRIPQEPGQPAAALWRDQVIVSSNRFARIDLDVAPIDFATVSREPLPEEPLGRVRAIRDWMTKNVRLAGPSFYELPLERQLTDPAVVLRERYGTRLDYVRTLCALLKGAGVAADIVLAAGNGDDPACVRERDKYAKPNVRAFDVALCRVVLRDGGFLGFGGTAKTYWLGTENEYAELAASGYDGSDFYDPAADAFGVIALADDTRSDRVCERTEIDVRENGAVDLRLTSELYGSGVGSFRKKYDEILPEERSRHFQTLVGGIAQAASATSELETDVTGYPARRSFACYVPDYATVSGDTLTLQVPALISSVPSFTGTARKTPLAIAASDSKRETVVVRFPEGYDRIEHVPDNLSFVDPTDAARRWMTSVTRIGKTADGRLEVTLEREVFKRPYGWFGSSYAELLKDWNRLATARANRTIVVRRK